MYKNCIRNANLDLVTKRVFIPAQEFVQSQVTGASVILDAGFGTGAAQLLELGTSAHGAIRLEATNDDVNYLWVPGDFDNRHPLHIRYLWTSDYASADGTATFTTLFTPIKSGEAVAIGATALTKTHGASAKDVATARAISWSKYGTIAPLETGTHANHTFNPEVIAVAFNVTCSAVANITIASDYVWLLGMELVYTPRITFGRSDRPARMLRDGLSANLELDVTNDV
jgi:hypothetical protein